MFTSPYLDDRGNIIDYYAVFHIPYLAEKEMVRTAFCNLIKLYHPDVSNKTSEKDKRITDLIIKGYKVLSDEKLRHEYDKQLFNKLKFNNKGYIYIPRTRVKYSNSLKDLLLKRLVHKRMKRVDRLYYNGQDVEIFITPQEASRGAIAIVELPSRTNCYICYGRDRWCNICHGVGRIPSASHLEVVIEPHTRDGAFVDVDLLKVRPDRFTSFRMKNLRVKICIIGKTKLPSSN